MNDKEISLKELIDVIWNGKWLIALVAVITMILAASGSFLYDRMNAQVGTIVTLQWSGISAGEYPDGTRFDYAEAIEPYVITRAIEELEMDLVSNDVRNALTVRPITPTAVLSMIENAILAGEELTYYATDYKILLNNGELGLKEQEASDLLNEIISQFRLDFERKYITRMQVLDFTDTDFTAYDYLESYQILNAQVDAIETTIGEYTDYNFYSSTLGMTFNDILVRTSLVTDVELSQVITRTNNYLLTKDKTYLITSYEYKIEAAQLALDIAIAKEIEVQDLVDNYQGSTTTILIPGLESVDLELDTYYNQLLIELVDLQNEIAERTENIAYYQLQVDRLEGNDPNFIISSEQQASEVAKVVEAINNADEQLETIVNDSNTLLSEYYEYVTSSIIKPLMTPEHQSNSSLLVVSLGGIVVGAVIGTAIVLFRKDWN